MNILPASTSSSPQNAETSKAEKVKAEPAFQKQNEGVDSNERQQNVKEEKSKVKIDIFADDDVVNEKKESNNQQADLSDNKPNEPNSVQVEST